MELSSATTADVRRAVLKRKEDIISCFSVCSMIRILETFRSMDGPWAYLPVERLPISCTKGLNCRLSFLLGFLLKAS
jgi:hypothetical protein